MWGFASNVFSRSLWLKNVPPKSNQGSPESSDDEPSLTNGREEGLECPICWESFNMVENVPYVLWCGHTLCKNCILGLQRAVVKLPTSPIQLPFFISCPWCNLFSVRVVYKGNVRFPCKNYFLLWMVESINGDRSNCHSSFQHDRLSLAPADRTLTRRSRSRRTNTNISTNARQLEHPVSGNQESRTIRSYIASTRLQQSLRKSFLSVIQFMAKFPLLIILVLLALYVIPVSAVGLALYLCITVVFAVPSFLVLYLAFPSLDWLVREIFT